MQQQQPGKLYTHISVPYWSPDIWLGLECFEIFSLDFQRNRKWAWQPKNLWARFARQWLNPPFWISKSTTGTPSMAHIKQTLGHVHWIIISSPRLWFSYILRQENHEDYHVIYMYQYMYIIQLLGNDYFYSQIAQCVVNTSKGTMVAQTSALFL